jgi:tetratricopeptide (TPR) repeat protein
LDGLAKYNESIEAFEKAIELNPKYVYAWKGKSDALRVLNRSFESDAALAKARELGYKS